MANLAYEKRRFSLHHLVYFPRAFWVEGSGKAAAYRRVAHHLGRELPLPGKHRWPPLGQFHQSTADHTSYPNEPTEERGDCVFRGYVPASKEHYQILLSGDYGERTGVGAFSLHQWLGWRLWRCFLHQKSLGLDRGKGHGIAVVNYGGGDAFAVVECAVLAPEINEPQMVSVRAQERMGMGNIGSGQVQLDSVAAAHIVLFVFCHQKALACGEDYQLPGHGLSPSCVASLPGTPCLGGGRVELHLVRHRCKQICQS